MEISSDVYDLCIVGAGMFGSAAARHASVNPALKVCLIGPDEPTKEERSKREIFAAHYDEGRITRILDDDPAIEIMSRNSINRYRELEKLSGIQFYDPVGFIMVGKKNFPFMRDVVQKADLGGVSIVDISRKETFQMRYPFLKVKDDDQIFLDDNRGGYISPRRMVAAQKKVAEIQGCHIINKTVEEVTPLQEGIHKIYTKEGNLIKAKRVLFCTGAFTNFKKFPLPKLAMDILPETAVFLRVSKEEAKRISSMPSIVYNKPEDGIGAYILPPIKYPDGQYYLKIGHITLPNEKEKYFYSLDEIKKWYLSSGDLFRVERFSKLLIKMLPGLKVEEISSMTCVTTSTPSGRPFIDRVTPTVTVAVAGNGKGAKFSEEAGRLAACLSLTGKWDLEMSQSQFEIIIAED